MVTASRLCEDLIIWSTSFAGFVQLDDAYCSSSSIMPQKKNPDTAEIMRAKTGTVSGSLAAAMMIAKGLPMSYNRDLQELTPHLWRGVEAAGQSLRLLSGMIASASFNTERMYSEADRGFSTATELADVLVREYGLPFRTAHRIVGRAVRKGSLELEALEEAAREAASCSLIERGLTREKVSAVLDAASSVAVRNAPGGPAPEAVQELLRDRTRALHLDESFVDETSAALSRATDSLLEKARELIS